MKYIIMAFGALAIAGAVPVVAQDATTPPPAPPAPDATMAPPAAPTPPAADGSMAPAQPGTMSPGNSSGSTMSPGSAGTSMSSGSSSGMQSSGMQGNMPAATTGPLPKCTAKVRDRCDQSATSERYALSADQAQKTGGVGDRRSDNAATGKSMMGKHPARHRMMHHKMMQKSTTDTPAA